MTANEISETTTEAPDGTDTAETAASVVGAADIRRAIDLLGDADPDVRIRAAVDLGTWRAESAAEALVERLGVEPSHAIRETLTWAVLRVVEAARPHLWSALTSERWLARLQVAHVLSKLGDPADAERLRSAIADPVDAVASRIWWAASQTHHPIVADALVSQLGRGDSELRNSLSIALDALGPMAIGPLVAALRRPEMGTVARTHAADTLGLVGSPDADPAALALIETASEPNAPQALRLAALNALGQLDVPMADVAIASALDAPDQRIAHLARRWQDRRSASRSSRSTRVQRAALAARTTGEARTAGQPRTAGPPTHDQAHHSGLGHGIIATVPGVLVELRCETAFVGDGSTLARLAERIAATAATAAIASKAPPTTRDDLLRETLGAGTVADALASLSAATGERIALGAVEHLPGRTVSYVQPAGSGRLPHVGVLVGIEGVDDESTAVLARKVAVHIATCAPAYLTPADVPVHVWQALREEVRAYAPDRGTADLVTEQRLERAVAARLAAYATESTLSDQVSITDPGGTVEALLYGRGIRITGFRRVDAGAADLP